MNRFISFALLLNSLLVLGMNQGVAQSSFSIALLTYNGGGDWYANPSALPNLVSFCNEQLNTNIDAKVAEVQPGDEAIFNFPFVHMTGHGNVTFSAQERVNLRSYLNHGGFLHIDDNYGMDPFIRREIQLLYPDKVLKPVPSNHPIYNLFYAFPDGLPKIHEHDGKTAEALGIFVEGDLVLLYTYETDLGDGWEDTDVHGDSEAIHQKALKMGANILGYAITDNY